MLLHAMTLFDRIPPKIALDILSTLRRDSIETWSYCCRTNAQFYFELFDFLPLRNAQFSTDFKNVTVTLSSLLPVTRSYDYTQHSVEWRDFHRCFRRGDAGLRFWQISFESGSDVDWSRAAEKIRLLKSIRKLWKGSKASIGGLFGNIPSLHISLLEICNNVDSLLYTSYQDNLPSFGRLGLIFSENLGALTNVSVSFP